jgi:hypothetical protein
VIQSLSDWLPDSYLLAFRYFTLKGSNGARERLSQHPAMLICECIERCGILSPHFEVQLLVSAGSVAANLPEGCGSLGRGKLRDWRGTRLSAPETRLLSNPPYRFWVRFWLEVTQIVVFIEYACPVRSAHAA